MDTRKRRRHPDLKDQNSLSKAFREKWFEGNRFIYEFDDQLPEPDEFYNQILEIVYDPNISASMEKRNQVKLDLDKVKRSAWYTSSRLLQTIAGKFLAGENLRIDQK